MCIGCVIVLHRYLMLINHPTDGATRGLTLRVRSLGRNFKKKGKKIILPKKNSADCSLIRSNAICAFMICEFMARRFVMAGNAFLQNYN